MQLTLASDIIIALDNPLPPSLVGPCHQMKNNCGEEINFDKNHHMLYKPIIKGPTVMTDWIYHQISFENGIVQ